MRGVTGLSPFPSFLVPRPAASQSKGKPSSKALILLLAECLSLETVTLSWAEGKQNTSEMSKHGLFKSNLLN